MNQCFARLIPLALVAAVAGAAGCAAPTSAEDEAAAYRQAIPSAERLRIRLPGAEAEQAGPEQAGTAQQAIVGERAKLYLITRDVSYSVNGAAYLWLSLVDDITDQPPTSIGNGVAVWGPHTPALSLITFVFTVTADPNGDFHYALDGKVKNQPDSAYIAIVTGVASPGPGGQDSGAMRIDASAAKSLDPTVHDSGAVEFTYADLGTHWRLDVGFDAYSNDGEEPIYALYHYLEKVDESGDFSFLAFDDIDDNGSQRETWYLRSRWLAGGSGRGDAVIVGGDLGQQQVFASECWNEMFERTYWTVDPASIEPTEGSEQSCVFEAAFPVMP